MVLPAPVGPTMAMVWPGFTSMFMSVDQRRIRLVAEVDMVELHRALRLRDHRRVGRLRRLFRLVEQLEDTLG